MNRSKVDLSVKPISRFTIGGQTNYTAINRNEEPPCGDENCDCTSSITGMGETRETAESDFWDQWEERELEREDARMRQLDKEKI